MPPTVLAGLPGSQAPRPVLVTSAAPVPRPSCLTSWACVHTHPTPPPVAVGALNKHRRGEERPVSSLCSHTTHNRPPCGSSTRHAPPCCPKHFLFQESTSQTIPWTTGVVLTHSHTGSWRLGKGPQHGWRRAATRRPGQGVPVVLQVGSRCWLSLLFSGEGWRGGGSWPPSQPKITWMS